jgi:hypothetical protein
MGLAQHLTVWLQHTVSWATVKSAATAMLAKPDKRTDGEEIANVGHEMIERMGLRHQRATGQEPVPYARQSGLGGCAETEKPAKRFRFQQLRTEGLIAGARNHRDLTLPPIIV